MPERAMSPTKSNYLKAKASLERATEGHDLLEQKRQILVMELVHRLQAATDTKDQVRSAMAEAYEALRGAAAESGGAALERRGWGVSLEHSMSISTRSVMGTHVPEIEFSSRAEGPEFSLSEPGSRSDEALSRFREAVGLAVRLAEVENAVFRVAREVKRTQRRVNALEKVFIPRYENTIKYIGDALEEREREALVIARKAQQLLAPPSRQRSPSPQETGDQ